MADLLPDDIVCNIFSRLPGKALLRLLCLSKYWNGVVREASFMNLRSRRIIIIPIKDNLRLIDDNVPIEDTCHSILERSYPLDENPNCLAVVIGTLNGIVLVSNSVKFILFNPFTGACKPLPKPPRVSSRFVGNGFAYGFGYGANAEDMKIVRFRRWTDLCEVYSFKKSCWSAWRTSKYNVNSIDLSDWVGKFLNGFLHWGTFGRNALTVLNVNNMVLSEIPLPFEKRLSKNPLGDIDGCLCTLQHAELTVFNMWVMKEYGVQNSWGKLYSFTLAPYVHTLQYMIYHPITILDSGKILMSDPFQQLFIYDASKDSIKMLDISLHYDCCDKLHGLEYVESLVSPSDIYIY